jgi:hypothetical protein
MELGMLAVKGNPHRFVVFGIRNDVLVEYSTDDIANAVLLHDWLSCSDYKAKVFDNKCRKFVKPQVLAIILRQL